MLGSRLNPAARTPSHPAHAGICAEFERRLRELNPQLRAITYDIGDLYSWVDNMPDLRWACSRRLSGQGAPSPALSSQLTRAPCHTAPSAQRPGV